MWKQHGVSCNGYPERYLDEQELRRVVLAQAREEERLKIEAESHYKKIFDDDMVAQKDVDFWVRQIDLRICARDVLLKLIGAKLEDLK